MDIVIIAHFCNSFSKTDNNRFLYIAKQLSKFHDVEIVTSSFYHVLKTTRKIPEEKWGFKITFIDEPPYKKNISLYRFYSHYEWGKNLISYIKKRKKPDVIYCAVPSLTGPYLVGKYCKNEGVRFVIDIQDLWPEAFKMVINYPIIKDVVFMPFTIMVNKLYKSADGIAAVSETYSKRAMRVNKRVNNAAVAYLGTDMESFDRYSKETPVSFVQDDEYLKIVYIGTLGNSYDLPLILNAIHSIKDKVPIKLLIMGDGPKRENFEAIAKNKNINCLFTGKIEYSKMVCNLFHCDIAVNPIIKGSAGSVITKVGDYAMAGLPVINTQESLEYRSMLDEYKAGINCRNGSVEDVSNAIVALFKNKEMREKMAAASRRLAEVKFNRAISYKCLFEEIENESANH